MTVREGANFKRSARIAALLAPMLVCAAAAVALASSSSATVTTAHGKLGTMLAGRNGHTLYLFMLDKNGKSSCYHGCTTYWPPDYTHGKPVAAPGSDLNSKLLGTTRRTNGWLQVTYAGHPLYFYSGDTKAGTMHGEALKQFGARWYAVGTSGKALEPKKASGWNPGSY